MPDQIKNNGVHSLLKILSSGNKYDWSPAELAQEMSTWYKKRSIYEINFLCGILGERKTLHQLSNEHWVIRNPQILASLRALYYGKEYKEKLHWWVWPARIGAFMVGAFAIWGVIDNSQSKILTRKLNEAELKIESLQKRIVKDSTEIQEKNERILQLIEENYETPINNKSDSSKSP